MGNIVKSHPYRKISCLLSVYQCQNLNSPLHVLPQLLYAMKLFFYYCNYYSILLFPSLRHCSEEKLWVLEEINVFFLVSSPVCLNLPANFAAAYVLTYASPNCCLTKDWIPSRAFILRSSIWQQVHITKRNTELPAKKDAHPFTVLNFG